MPRFRVRTMMIVVGVVALILASIGPVRQSYHRWSYYRAQAALYAQLEATERLNDARESRAATDRGRIRAGLLKSTKFLAGDPGERERMIDNVALFHRQQAARCRAAARSWAEKRRDSERAALFCWDPFAPDVP